MKHINLITILFIKKKFHQIFQIYLMIDTFLLFSLRMGFLWKIIIKAKTLKRVYNSVINNG